MTQFKLWNYLCKELKRKLLFPLGEAVIQSALSHCTLQTHAQFVWFIIARYFFSILPYCPSYCHGSEPSSNKEPYEFPIAKLEKIGDEWMTEHVIWEQKEKSVFLDYNLNRQRIVLSVTEWKWALQLAPIHIYEVCRIPHFSCVLTKGLLLVLCNSNYPEVLYVAATLHLTWSE